MRLALTLGLVALGCSSKSPGSRATPAPVTPIALPAGPGRPAIAPPRPSLRLPDNLEPTGYSATLSIDPAKPVFSGRIAITAKITERSSVVWLHGKALTITRATVAGAALQVTPVGEDLLELRAEPPLEAGTHTLSLEYTGLLEPLDTAGAFVQTAGGAPYVFTQLEALYARRVFPCVDEPDVKVPWQLTLEVPAGNLAVSNTSVVRETQDGTTRRFEFARTRPLPSYLVAFGIGPFEIVDAGKAASGAPIRIVTLRGRAAEAAFAARTTKPVLDELEAWFGMPYPYEKLDVLSIPLTVGFGAMENAGLVTMAESLMLLDPQTASWGQRRSYTAVAAHELAHQWFGDLVTMRWWDDLWLNEGFATWLGGKITAKLDPGTQAELATLDTRSAALGADAVVSARRVRQPIDSRDDIYNAFDGITYSKGAAVLAMFESFVGADVFQRGVRAYIEERSWSNATSADFIAAVSGAAGRDLAPAFSTFLDRTGAPELTASIVCEGASARIDLTQQRFVAPGSPAPDPQPAWHIPVCVAYDQAGARATACTLLTTETGTLALPGARCPRWVMPNVDGRGYYRTRYTRGQAEALRDLAWASLTPGERRTVYFDVASTSRYRARGVRKTLTGPPSGALPVSLVLSFMPKLVAAPDRFTVSDGLETAVSLARFVPDAQRATYERWLRDTFGTRARDIGLVPRRDDRPDDEAIRGELVRAVAWQGKDPQLVAKAVTLAKRWRDLPPAVRGQILMIAADADAQVFATLVRDVKQEPDRTRRGDLFAALAAVRDPSRLEQGLALLLDPEVDLRESIHMLLGTSTEATRQVAERFLRTNEQALLQRLPKDAVTGVIGTVALVFAGSCDAALRDEARQYVTAHFGKLAGGERVIAQAFEAMDQCIASRAVVEPELAAWLARRKRR